MTAEQFRKQDGSAGDADYGVIGNTYSDYRRPDPRIAQAVWDALGDARTVLNVGAGAGSYEPTDRDVTAIEPSASMRKQRPTVLSRAIDAVAESLPFPDNSFDAAMTTFSVHQWGDLTAGLAEIRRVTRGPVVILTCDPHLLDRFWLAKYAPGVISTERRRYPTMSQLVEGLGGTATVDLVPISLDCTDGFNEAYYGSSRGAACRGGTSCLLGLELCRSDASRPVHGGATDRADSGEWDAAHGALRQQPTFEGSLVVFRAMP